MRTPLLRKLRSLVSFGALLCWGVEIKASGYDTWAWRNPLPQGHALTSVTFGNGRYVAVGAHGTVLISSNRLDWTVASTGRDEFLGSIAFGAGHFLAVSRDRVIASTDGTVWTRSYSNFGGAFTAISYGNGLFVAVGAEDFNRNNLFASTNGVEWSAYSVRTRLSLRAVAVGDIGIAAFGDWGAGEFSNRSFSGGLSAVFPIAGPFVVAGVAAAGSQFVSVLNTGAIYTAHPFDLRPHGWEPVAFMSAQPLTAIHHTGSQFIAVGLSGTILTSPDGVHWTSRTGAGSANLSGVTQGELGPVAVGENGAIVISDDAESWRRVDRVMPGRLYGIVPWNGGWIAIGWDDRVSAPVLLRSTDGADWLSLPAQFDRAPRDIAASASRLVATTQAGELLISDDGATWRTTQIEDGNVRRVTAADGRFLAAGSNGESNPDLQRAELFTSTDGLSWQRIRSVPGEAFEDVAVGAGTIVAVGTDRMRRLGIVQSLAQGGTWQGASFGGLGPEWDSYSGVAYGNGRFVVVGARSILTSTDGGTWTFHPEPPAGFDRVRFLNGVFVALTSTGVVGISEDGERWTLYRTPTDAALSDVAEINGTLVVVGAHAHILQSDPIVRIEMTASTAVRLHIRGPVGAGIRIESTDAQSQVATWTPEATVSLVGGSATWLAGSSTVDAMRFYRAVLLPK